MLTQKRICELVTGESRSPMRFEIRAIEAVERSFSLLFLHLPLDLARVMSALANSGT